MYTLPPSLALSRILFTLTTFNGSNIPVSAFVVWPWQAKSFELSSISVSDVPVTGWGHGTSDLFGECGHSRMRGVCERCKLRYRSSPKGFARTLEEVRHDGAFARWRCGMGLCSATSGQTGRRVGAISVAPPTDIIENIKANSDITSSLACCIASGVKSIFASFDLSEWMLEEGVKRANIMREVQGCNAVDVLVFGSTQRDEIMKPNWEDNWYLPAFNNLTYNGRQPISKPILVMQGTDDGVVKANVTAKMVYDSCTMYPDSQITYVSLTHMGALHAYIVSES